MKLKNLVFILTFLTSCEGVKIVPGSLESISGAYVSDEIWMENQGEKYFLRLVFMFDEGGKKGTFNARLENHTPGQTAVEDITGEMDNFASNTQKELKIKDIPLISLNTHKVFVLNAVGELDSDRGKMSTRIEIKSTDFLLRQAVDFSPVRVEQ